MPGTQVLVQLSKSHTESPRFMDLNALSRAIELDPDLSGIPSPFRCQALQTLYVSTGCDYVSFFVGMGKASFLSTFFQYATFIAGGDPSGSLGEVSLDKEGPSFLSFVRLVGCAYFKSHTSAFEYTTPVTLFHSIKDYTSSWDQHAKWLAFIRKAVWLRADSDSKSVPSIEAIQLHWYRSLWVLDLWHKSTQNEIDLPGKHTNILKLMVNIYI